MDLYTFSKKKLWRPPPWGFFLSLGAPEIKLYFLAFYRVIQNAYKCLVHILKLNNFWITLYILYRNILSDADDDVPPSNVARIQVHSAHLSCLLWCSLLSRSICLHVHTQIHTTPGKGPSFFPSGCRHGAFFLMMHFFRIYGVWWRMKIFI